MRLSAALTCLTLAIATQAGAQSQTPAAPSPAQPANAQPTVVCGMTIFPANPNVDAKAVKPLPQGGFVMRTERPRVCRSQARAPRGEPLRQLPQIFGPRR
jgi:hypothetical protein